MVELTLIGDEPHRPYDRPPLSKQVLQGAWEPEQTFFRRKDGYDALALDMRLGVRAVSVDLRARRVALADGTFADYDRLIIATGARVPDLPGLAPRAGLLVLRSLDDAIALRLELMHATRVAIVGAGFIGLEVAASCRARGLDVTVIEALPLPLSQILGPTLCEMIAATHRDHGVDLRAGVTVTDVVGESRVAAVVLSDGSRIEADVVVVGIGVTPNTEWLEGSGLTLDNGVVCNGSGKASPMCMRQATWPGSRTSGTATHRESSIGPTQSSKPCTPRRMRSPAAKGLRVSRPCRILVRPVQTVKFSSSVAHGRTTRS